MIVLVQGCLEGRTGGQLSLGPQPICGPHLRNNDRNNRYLLFLWKYPNIEQGPILKSGRVHLLRTPFRGILNALEYCAPVFSGGGQGGGNPGECGREAGGDGAGCGSREGGRRMRD